MLSVYECPSSTFPGIDIQVNENKDNLNKLSVVMKSKLHSGTKRVDVIGKRQKVSSLDGYRKSLQRKNMKNDNANDDDGTDNYQGLK